MYGRNELYKYLGKELSLSGECKSQVTDTITLFKDLVLKIKISSLPLALRSSALGVLAFAGVLHRFCGTRIGVSLRGFGGVVTSTVREMYGLYSTTTQTVIYLPRSLEDSVLKEYLMFTEPHDWLS